MKNIKLDESLRDLVLQYEQRAFESDGLYQQVVFLLYEDKLDINVFNDLYLQYQESLAASWLYFHLILYIAHIDVNGFVKYQLDANNNMLILED